MCCQVWIVGTAFEHSPYLKILPEYMEGLLNELPRLRKSDDWNEEDGDSDDDLEVDE